MIFLSFFKTLEGKTVTVELKNDLQITGTLASVDQFLNFKLANARAVDSAKFPQLLSVKDMFVRGSVIRYVSVPVSARGRLARARARARTARAPPRTCSLPARAQAAEVDTGLLQDAARREAMEAAKVAAAGGASARR